MIEAGESVTVLRYALSHNTLLTYISLRLIEGDGSLVMSRGELFRASE